MALLAEDNNYMRLSIDPRYLRQKKCRVFRKLDSCDSFLLNEKEEKKTTSYVLFLGFILPFPSPLPPSLLFSLFFLPSRTKAIPLPLPLWGETSLLALIYSFGMKVGGSFSPGGVQERVRAA